MEKKVVWMNKNGENVKDEDNQYDLDNTKQSKITKIVKTNYNV